MRRRLLKFAVFAGVGTLLAARLLVPICLRAQQPRAPQKYALLVGVTEYPNLDKKWWLEGPTADVAMMGEVLQDAPFSIPPANIARLSGWPQAAAERPTRANIEAQFRRLAQIAERGDRVVILMSGHGSQQPANPSPKNDEPDGLDELFLPADIGRWDGTAGSLTNAIVDDDIRAWLTNIRNKGASVWIIFDSCHSGTMTRGTSAERERQIPMRDLVPESVIQAMPKPRPAPAAGASATSVAPFLDLSRDAADIVALYASQATETTPEKRIPTASSPYHGLFTYTIASILKSSRSPLTYRELAERVIERYRSDGRFGPNPMFEGGGGDQEILGENKWPGRPELLLGVKRDTGWQLRAGSIHGLTPGTILQLFPRAGDVRANMPFGHVKVVSVEATESLVEPAAFGGMAAPPAVALVPGSRGRIASYELGATQLRVALQVQTHAATGAVAPVYEAVAEGSGPRMLERALADLPNRTMQLARRTVSEADADWVVRTVNGRVVLLPASGWYVNTPGTAAGGTNAQNFTLGADTDPMLAERLQSSLRRIARAKNLLKIAGSASEGEDINFDVELMRYENGRAAPVPKPAGGRTLRAGDVVAFQIINRGTQSIDVTLLLVDNSYAIESMFPPPDAIANARLEAGQSRLTERFNVTASGVELEQIVAIAVKASNPPVNFSVLSQQGVAVTRSAPSNGPGSALQDLLESAVSGSGSMTRGLTPARVNESAMRVIAWRAEPSGQ